MRFIPNKYSQFFPPVVLILLPTLLYWRVVFLGEVVYWGTPLLQFYPWRKLAVEIYKSGQIPLWNPYVGFGAPLAANLQSAVFYPLNFFYLFIPVEKAMGYTIVLHVMLAGLFMYLAARTVGISREGSLLSAVAYMFSGYIISRAHFISMVSAVPWLPLLLAATEGVVSRNNAMGAATGLIKGHLWGWMIVLAAGTGMLLLAGHIQLAFYSLSAICAYAIFRVISIFRGVPVAMEIRPPRPFLAVLKRNARLNFAIARLVLFGLAIAAGVALAGVQLLPTAELYLLSVRSSGAEYDFALTYSLWPWQLIGAVFPTLMGHPGYGGYRGPGNFWETAMYIGAIPLLLAVIGAIRGRSTLRVYLLALAVTSVVLSLGHYTPIYPWVFTHVPGFGLFQAPSRLLVVYTFALSVLCGLGLDAVKERVPGYCLRLGVAAGLAVFLMAAALALIAREIGLISYWTAFHTAVTGLVFSIGCILLLKYGAGTWEKAPLALTALVFAELFMYGEGLNPTTSVELYRSPSGGLARYLEDNSGLYRVYTSEEVNLKKFFNQFYFKEWGPRDWPELAALRDQLPPDLSSAYGISEAYNYDPIRLRRTSRLAKEAEDAGMPSQLIKIMNVKYLLTDKEERLGSLTRTDEGLPPGLQEAGSYLPRAFVATKARVVDSEDEALQAIFSNNFDPSSEVVIEGGHVEDSTNSNSPGDAEVNITEYAPNRVNIDVNSGGGFLVLSDTYYPGWRAYVDGEQKQVLRANFNFRAVVLDGGHHTVIFEYESDSFKVGLWSSGLGAAFLAAISILWARERWTSRKNSVVTPEDI